MSETLLGAERRTHARRLVNLAAQVVLRGSGQVQRFGVRIVDISSGGVGILADASPPLGLVFELEWTPLDRNGQPKPLLTQVKVMNSLLSSRHGGFKIGGQFVELGPPARDIIDGIVGS